MWMFQLSFSAPRFMRRNSVKVRHARLKTPEALSPHQAVGAGSRFLGVRWRSKWISFRSYGLFTISVCAIRQRANIFAAQVLF
ncbi:hypothetical protein X975_16909, partial [Stegodyphus mimosarum]